MKRKRLLTCPDEGIVPARHRRVRVRHAELSGERGHFDLRPGGGRQPQFDRAAFTDGPVTDLAVESPGEPGEASLLAGETHTPGLQGQSRLAREILQL